jgi:hypothetical protein
MLSSPVLGELEVLFSSAPVDTSRSESIASHDRSINKKLYSMDAELDKRRKNKTGRKQQTGSGSGGGSDSDGWSNQAVPAPFSTYTPLNRLARTSDGIVRAFGVDHTSNVGSSGGGAASVARRAGSLGGARGDGQDHTDGGSKTTAGFCAEERRQHEAQWAHARAHLYVDYAVAANQPTSSGGTWLAA